MKGKLSSILFTIISIFISASVSFAQDNVDFKIGDTIYVNAYYAGCVKATVKQIEPKYYVHLEEGSHKATDLFYGAGRIGECPQKTVETKNAQPYGDQTPTTQMPLNQPQNTSSLKVGARVDVYLSGGKEGKNRGTILEVGNSEYKVRYDGCAEKYDVWENSTLVLPTAEISKNNAEIKFLVGKWSMTTVGISDVAIAWGKSPGIQINADGTYIWYQEMGKQPIEGEWITHAKIEGARFGTETENGIVIYDVKGHGWKMYRRKSTLDNEDHITIRMMCDGVTQMGARAQ